MEEFDYYKYGTRLIRVNESIGHFRDITPYKTAPLTGEFLKSIFPNGFNFLASLNLSLDNDEFISLYNSFKPTIRTFDMSTGKRVDDDQREYIIKHLEAGSSVRRIAELTGVGKSTIHRIAKSIERIDHG